MAKTEWRIEAKSSGAFGTTHGQVKDVLNRAFAKLKNDLGKAAKPSGSDKLRLLQNSGRIVQESCRMAVLSGGWGPQDVYGYSKPGEGYVLIPRDRTASFQPTTGPRAGKTPLRGKGKLASSIRYYTAGDEIIIRSSRIDAAVHQFGKVIKAKSWNGMKLPPFPPYPRRAMIVRVPDRPYIGFSDKAMRQIVTYGKKFVIETVKALGWNPKGRTSV